MRIVHVTPMVLSLARHLLGLWRIYDYVVFRSDCECHFVRVVWSIIQAKLQD
jgi:hypothetical protein